MKKFLLTLFALALAVYSMAQERNVSGKVTSTEDGNPLPGVNVIVKGTTIGTSTDAEGNFTLALPQSGGALIFSFIGLESKEIEVGDRTVVDVSLALDITQLSEVVVTAGGIQREAKALGYAVTSVSAEKIQGVGELDPLRALQGKVPGVNIMGSSGAPGSSTRITIRGNASLLGNNQPLFVVDGIPYNNDNNGLFNGLASGSAYSSRLADLDPNNIETINILKGGAAAALYGTRAANGVILITTKTGSSKKSRKGMEISYGMTYALEEIANLPEYQNTYGTGTRFIYQPANGSWGAPFVGTKPYATTTTIPHWYNGIVGMEQYWGTTVPYQAYPDNVEKLFKTGSILDNSLTVSGGNEKSNLAVTVSRSDNDGYVPNTFFDRTSISVGGRTVLDNKLMIGGNLTYSNTTQHAVQSGVGASGSNNPSAFARALYMGRNWDVHGQPYQNPLDLGSEFMVGRGQADNPLWSYENVGFDSEVNRIAAVLDAGYDIKEWFNLSYKVGINQYSQNDLDYLRPGSTGPSGNPGVGRITTGNVSWEEIESTLMANLTPKIGDDFSLRAIVGHNINQRTQTSQYYQGLTYVIFDIDDIDNTNAVSPAGGGYSQRRLVGVFANVSLGYKDWAFLELQGRNDWSSTLPKNGNSFFYPAVSASVLLSEALGMSSNTVNHLKVRGSWSQVGNDTNPYQLRPTFTINPFGRFPYFGNISGATLSNTERDPNLKPERTKEIEAGLEVKLFNNKIDLNVTGYKRRTFDQIASISLPSSTGFNFAFTNFGEVSNTGIEIGLGVTPVALENSFAWNIYGTFTHNKNVVEELALGISEMTFGPSFAGGVTSVHRAGEEYGLIRGTVSARDDEGNLLINPANGELLTALNPAIIGNPNPDFIVGVTNTFSFKGFSLNAVVDWRQGGDQWSNTVLSLIGRGVTKDTEDREVNSVIPGVYGNPTTLEPIRDQEGNKITNTTMVEENGLWFGNTFAINGVSEYATWDATVIRLREVTLAYQFPKSILSKTPFGTASLSLTGRNLWFNAPNFPKYTNWDPEVGQFGNSNTQGIEWSTTPTTKRYSVSLRLTF